MGSALAWEATPSGRGRLPLSRPPRTPHAIGTPRLLGKRRGSDSSMALLLQGGSGDHPADSETPAELMVAVQEEVRERE